MNMGRLGGVILLGLAGVVCLLGAGLVLPRLAAEGPERLTVASAILGLVLAAVVALPLAGIGVFLLVRGREEAKTDVVAAKQRRLLDMVTTRGQLALGDAAVELQVPRDDIKNWVYRLVGLGAFSGYVNWDDGILFSKQASELRNMQNCAKCGGKLEMAGKGVIKCPYCGTEYFLP